MEVFHQALIFTLDFRITDKLLFITRQPENTTNKNTIRPKEQSEMSLFINKLNNDSVPRYFITEYVNKLGNVRIT